MKKLVSLLLAMLLVLSCLAGITFAADAEVEYTVSGWDILYPVRHEAVFGIGKSPKYILTSDLENKDSTK